MSNGNPGILIPRGRQEFVEEYRVVESKEDDILSEVFDEQDGMSL